MATESLVLSNPLWFLVAKFGKSAVKPLKSVVIDFYNVDALAEAKPSLLRDVDSIKSSINLPHMPKRRDGEDRVNRVVDDIFTILTCLDEHQKWDCLPKYVADNPESMPSTRLYDGDLAIFSTSLDKLKAVIYDQGLALAAIARDVQALQVQVQSTTHAGSRPCSVEWPVLGNSTRGSSQSVDHRSGQSAVGGQSADKGSERDWASLAPAASTPIANKFDALNSITDREDDCVDEQQPFTLVQSRRYKRQRPSSSPVQAAGTAAATRSTTASAATAQQRRRGPLVLGTSTATGTIISAAERRQKKVVLCIDNIGMSCTEMDMKSFISSLSVNAVSCFEVKPRRRRNEAVDQIKRKAFRVCVYENQLHHLLNADIWPDSVTISEWYFKPKDPSESTRQGALRVTGDNRYRVDDGAAAAAHETCPKLIDNGNDDTVSVNYEEAMNSDSSDDNNDKTVYDVADGVV